MPMNPVADALQHTLPAVGRVAFWIDGDEIRRPICAAIPGLDLAAASHPARKCRRADSAAMSEAENSAVGLAAERGLR